MLVKKIGKLSFLAGHWPLCEDLPTLIFLHSSGCNAQMWQEQVVGLMDIANTIAIDLPGHGESDGPGLESIVAYAAVVADFIEEIKAPRPVPCGLSIGSAIVLQLLLDYPNLASAGILVGAGARLRVSPTIFEAITQDYGDFVDLLGRLSFSPGAAHDTIQEISTIMLACPPTVAAGDFRACDSFDVIARLSEINHRALIISGEDDKLTPTKYADFLEQNLNYATRIDLVGTGHMMPNEKPTEVNNAIRNFIRESFRNE